MEEGVVDGGVYVFGRVVAGGGRKGDFELF